MTEVCARLGFRDQFGAGFGQVTRFPAPVFWSSMPSSLNPKIVLLLQFGFKALETHIEQFQLCHRPQTQIELPKPSTKPKFTFNKSEAQCCPYTRKCSHPETARISSGSSDQAQMHFSRRQAH